MLGAVDRDHAYRIVDALIANDGATLLAESAALAARGLALGTALDELASLFHRIAVAQVVPTAAVELEDAAKIRDYAARFSPEGVQLAYQICAQGRADLALAPDEETGFAMTLLRLLAFEPATPALPAKPAAPSSAAPSMSGERSTKLVDSNVAALRAPARASSPRLPSGRAALRRARSPAYEAPERLVTARRALARLAPASSFRRMAGSRSTRRRSS